MSNEPGRLYRSTVDRKVWGVCGGLGDFFGLDPVWLRLLFVLLIFVGGSGILLYVVLALITPSASDGNVTPGQQPVPGNVIPSTTIGTSGRPHRPTSGATVVGVVFIVVGLIVLLANFHVFSWFRSGVVVPLVLILLGILLFLNRRK